MDLVQARPGRTVEVPRCAVAKAVAVAGDEREGGRRRAGRGRGLPETRDGGGGLPRSRGITRRPETREGDGGGPSLTREGGAMEAAARWRSRENWAAPPLYSLVWIAFAREDEGVEIYTK